MKLKNICLLASLFILSTNSLFSDVKVPYGEGEGKVDYSNINRFPELEEALPYGPLSFRIVGDKTWVADSVGGKLMQFGKDGKFISEFSVLPKDVKAYTLDEEGLPDANILIDDIAPVFNSKGELEAWWIADSSDNKLLKFSADGTPLAQLEDLDYGQLFRLEVGVGGHLFVADKITRKIFVYDSNGDFKSEQNWEWSGMAVAGQEDTLYRLIYFKEENKHMLVSTDVDGNVLKSVTLDVEMDDPELWWIDEEKQEAVITYNPDTGYEGEYIIARVGLDGKVKASGKLPAPFVMNRFIDHQDYKNVYIGKCNYEEAPNGNFEIVPFKMP